MKMIKNKYFITTIILIVAILPTFINLIRPGLYPMQDDLQAFRTQQMFKCMQDFQIPCRWIPDMGYQYGYPQFIFYPPSVYYLGASLHLLGIQIIDAVKIMFILGFILSTVFMYGFLKIFFDNESKDKSFVHTSLPAFVGAMLYSYVPYKALEVFVRGALNEFWSMVFFPLIFLFSYLVIVKKSNKNIVLLSVSVGGLLLTHSLMSMIFSPLAFVWCLTLMFLRNSWKVLPKLIFSVLLGVGIAAFFTLPMLFEGKYVHLESLLGGYFDYRQHFVNINRLFISNHFGYGSSGLNQDNDLTLSTGQIQWMFALITVFLAFFSIKRQRNLAVLTIVFSICELGILFMIHQKSSFIWDKLSFLVWLQFPWRFLTNSIFLLSLLGALGVYFISFINQKFAKICSLFLLAGIFILHVQFFVPKTWYSITDTEKFSGVLWDKQLTISIFDYLPIYSILPPINKAPEKPEVLEGKASFYEYTKGSDYQKGRVNVNEESLIRIPLFDFPGMEVKIDDKKVDHWHDDCRNQPFCYGLITFKIPTGDHTVDTSLTNTLIRTLGNVLSVVSILIAIYLFKKYKHEKIY